MVVTELDFDLAMVKGSLPIHGDGTRSTGLHVTEIIHSLAKSIGIVEESATPDQLATYGAVGFMWERVVEQGMVLSCMSDRYIRPGEIVLDGIAGSPDLLDLQDGIVIDTKVTFKSSTQLVDLQRNFWHWLVQVKCYCHMVGWSIAEFWVLPICGNWKPPMIQPPRRIRVEFGPVELADNWQMIINYAKEQKCLK